MNLLLSEKENFRNGKHLKYKILDLPKTENIKFVNGNSVYLRRMFLGKRYPYMYNVESLVYLRIGKLFVEEGGYSFREEITLLIRGKY